MAAKRSVDVIITVLTRFGGKSVNLLVFLLVARALNLTEMGIYGFVFSTTLILSTMLDLGVRNSLAVFVGKEPERLAAFTRTAGMLWALSSILAVPAIFLSFHLTDMTILDAKYVVPAILLLGAMVFIRMLQGTLLGSGAIAQFNRSELASRVVLLILSGGLLLFDRLDLEAALWTLALSQAFSALYLAFCIRQSLFSNSPEWVNIARMLIARGAPFMVCVLMMNASRRMSFFAVGQMTGVEDAGLFFALQRLTEIITEVGLAVSVVVFSHTVRDSSPERAAKNAAESTRMCLAVFLVISAVFGVSAPWSLPLLMGGQFHGDVFLFEVILLGTLAGSVWTILFPTVSVLTRPTSVMLIFLPGLILNVVSVYLLIPILGAVGGAWALLASNIILTISFLVFFRRRFGLAFTEFLLPQPSDFAGMLSKLRRKKGAVR
jgi:O-antigen/teichoic acid export membrane protein